MILLLMLIVGVEEQAFVDLSQSKKRIQVRVYEGGGQSMHKVHIQGVGRIQSSPADGKVRSCADPSAENTSAGEGEGSRILTVCSNFLVGITTIPWEIMSMVQISGVATAEEDPADLSVVLDPFVPA
jgi:hypothetical protein